MTETMEEDGGPGRTVREIWGEDSIKLGYRIVAARLRADKDAMDFLVGPEGVTPEVADLLDGLIAVSTVLALDRPEAKAYDHRTAFSRKLLAELFDRWADVLDGIEPPAAWWYFHGGRAAFDLQPEGNCAGCGKLMPLDDDLIGPHPLGRDMGPTQDRTWKCPGSGMRPHDVLAPREHLPYRNGSR